jgi:uncharacterized RDD family membrane protein YckC
VGTVSAGPLGSSLFCSECGRGYPAEDLARFGNRVVCADCKPHFVQRIQEGALAPGSVVYGGFWRRLVAMLIDGIIMLVVYFPLNMLLGAGLGGLRSGIGPGMLAGFLGMSWIISFGLNLAYQTYFLSQKGATPGKMVMGLKVVTASGGRLSVGRAVGRYFGYWVSTLTFCIGYVIAAFDSQKRALHDHICGTRVIREV